MIRFLFLLVSVALFVIACFFLQLGSSSTLSADVSSVTRDDFDASVEANVTHLVTGWMPLMDSSLKGSVVVNASANSSYEQLEVQYAAKSKLRLTTAQWNVLYIDIPFRHNFWSLLPNPTMSISNVMLIKSHTVLMLVSCRDHRNHYWPY